jgi:hypothetical protein
MVGIGKTERETAESTRNGGAGRANPGSAARNGGAGRMKPGSPARTGGIGRGDQGYLSGRGECPVAQAIAPG